MNKQFKVDYINMLCNENNIKMFSNYGGYECECALQMLYEYINVFELRRKQYKHVL